ncbi:MAG: hypothetical protein AAF617_15580 [Bacteroidota bacterium]
MKKKNLKLGKLTLKKTNVASLVEKQQIKGGSNGPGCNSGGDCTVSCVQNTCTSVPPPRPTNVCNTKFPQCQMTDFACDSNWNPTRCNCHTSPGDFLCDAGGFGGGQA